MFFSSVLGILRVFVFDVFEVFDVFSECIVPGRCREGAIQSVLVIFIVVGFGFGFGCGFSFDGFLREASSSIFLVGWWVSRSYIKRLMKRRG